MTHARIFSSLLVLMSLALSPLSASADQLRIAVASNFKPALLEIARLFETEFNHDVLISAGSTGKHFAQIVNGAPYDLFLAADIERPELLERKGLIVGDSRQTYAIGRLVLWGQDKDQVDPSGVVLQTASFRYLAIANPLHAPYGKAAMQVLKRQPGFATLQTKLVRGENVAQAFQFVRSGNAELGLLAYSQIKNIPVPQQGSFWLIPQNLYTPVEQQLVLLKDSAAGKQWLVFMQSEGVLEILRKYGYDTPDVK